MTKYLFIYHGPPAPDRHPSPETMQQMFAKWNAWKEKYKTQVVDVGDGLKNGGKVLKDGNVTDGPLPEAKEIIGGFSIIQSETVDGAIEVARACPITLMPNSTIEIRELMGF